jgi:hypothetical protein
VLKQFGGTGDRAEQRQLERGSGEASIIGAIEAEATATRTREPRRLRTGISRNGDAGKYFPLCLSAVSPGCLMMMFRWAITDDAPGHCYIAW